MQLKHIEYFVETSNYKSFNEAAKNLFISQPSLSAAIATLEKELGFKLFNRTKHGIELSTSGSLILPDAKQMLAIQKHWSTLSQKLSLFNEPLTIYAQELLCSTILVDFSFRINNLYPNIVLNIKPTEVISINDNLEGNTVLLDFYDIQQFETLKSNATTTNWTIVPVSTLQTILFLNGKHPLAKQELIQLTDMSQLDLVTYSSALSTEKSLPYHDLLNNFHDIINLPSREGQLNYIRSYPQASGLFSSLCMYYPYVQNGSIVARTIGDHPMPIFLAAIYPKDADLASFYEPIIDEICKLTHTFIQENNIIV
ncbi:MAG: LysR family transcriptional regulator [Peptococcaceae bacterium]|nr:LysR family transcriptional regulator [Peptococcaceae bacterium]